MAVDVGMAIKWLGWVAELVYNISMNVKDFAIGTEKMIDPMGVGKTHYMQTRLRKLPVSWQKKLVQRAAKSADKMGFVVEPYAFFLFYEVARPERVQKYLPDGFHPAMSRVFKGDEQKYYGIVCIFRVHTSAFWGARAEFYAVAEDTVTGLLSWVILDYLSDTISYDETNGLRSPSAPGAVVTTTCEGQLIARMRSINDGKRVSVLADLAHAKMRPLDPTLWIEGNTSIAHGRLTGEADGDLFSLTFLPEEMKQAWEIPVKDVLEAKVAAFPEVFGGELDKAVCFPFAQHMLSDSPSTRTHYGNEVELRKAAEAVKFSKLKTFLD